MPPKKVVEAPPPAPIVGAKFAYISCVEGIRVMINCNCRLDIVLDYARQDILSLIHERIEALKNDPNAVAEENFQGTVDKLLEIHTTLHGITSIDEIDLIADGATINCKQVF